MRKSIAHLEAELEAAKAYALGLQSDLAALRHRLQHDYVERAEYSRVQRLLSTTQQFCKKYKQRATAAPAAPSARRAAMEEAKRRAMETGQSVRAF